MFDDKIFVQMLEILIRIVLFGIALYVCRYALKQLFDEMNWHNMLPIFPVALIVLSGGYILWSVYQVILVSVVFPIIGALVLLTVLRGLGKT